MLSSSSRADREVCLLKKRLNKVLPSLFCFSNEADFCLYLEHGVEEGRREVTGIFCLETGTDKKVLLTLLSQFLLPPGKNVAPWQKKRNNQFLYWLSTSFLFPLVLSLWWGEQGFLGTQKLFPFFFPSITFPLLIDKWKR